jgi:hypothetical protein
MYPSPWLHAKLEIYKDWIILVGFLGTILSIAGISIASLWPHLPGISPVTILVIIAILNTVITLAVIRWGTTKKSQLVQAAKLIEDNGLAKLRVSKELSLKWNQEPSKEQVQWTLVKLYEILKK